MMLPPPFRTAGNGYRKIVLQFMANRAFLLCMADTPETSPRENHASPRQLE
jgi:hypothetical protein